MSNTLNEVGPKAHVAEIVQHGEKLILPSGMNIDDAINLLEKRAAYLGETTVLSETFGVFPWDGAYAFAQVLTARYGWAPATATPGFWGSTPPKLISIDVDYNKTVQAPWGSFSLPNVSGLLTTATDMKDGRIAFRLYAKILRKDEATVQALFDDVRAYLRQNSIYRGKAIRMRFNDEHGTPLEMPEPKFLNVTDIDLSQMVYSREIEATLDTNLFTPIRRVDDIIKNNIPVKRGVLLGGTYGTGKTLAAKAAAKLAVESGHTYLYVERADEFAQALDFAKQYQSPAAVVFCEDIDRAMAGERSVEMDDILNIIDGVDTKTSNLIIVLTTNDLNAINPAMLRPGRLDAVIEVTAPDAEAIERLLRVYGGEAIDEDTDLTAAGQVLAGTIPAVVAEVVKRAKLAQLRLTPPGEKIQQLSEAALVEAAHTMSSQLRLLKERSEAKAPPITIDGLLREIVNNSTAADDSVSNSLRAILK